MSMPFSNLLCELGQGTHPLWAPLATNENAGIGQGDFSEASFSPDSLSVMDSVGTAGPVSSSQPYQGMLIPWVPSAFPETFLLRGKVEGLLKGKCIMLSDSLERT